MTVHVRKAYGMAVNATADPAAYRREIEERLLGTADPWKTVEAFGIEDMIDPRKTRAVLAAFVNASLPGLRSRLEPPSRGAILP